ncbi:dihydroxyacetone kinase subunit L [Neorhizobium sp. P12A]|jgi:dihydroxyacetone kinase-like protein|uniref:dihydroxyacetone kinase subunit DhaL n=1 Tax=Rhizobium/Agrobacterium group TaxID=227290 RepID=UPI0010539967|nr:MULTISPECIES: dihydroxyacetone kinase subunit DhaL [Rhizobium/Agrobacterium group]KAA0691936.1 dihydroxyacetone kinase subunit L [Neorhizobium sp. P12A]TCR74798.1 dihydroxyacetone kinase DhaL subunit [Rhizobium sp. BK376]
MSESPASSLAKMFEMISKAIENEKDRLSELDGAIGDGDHGITMSIGFAAVHKTLSKLDLGNSSLSEVMSTAADAFLDAVGASSGPLYSTGFRRAAKTLAGHSQLDVRACADMIRGISSGIAERGKGQRGDKTMLDVWLPAADAAANAIEEDKTGDAFWSAVIASADNGAAATRSMIATKGRAARLRERSLGHIDPGAASATVMIHAMAKAIRL